MPQPSGFGSSHLAQLKGQRVAAPWLTLMTVFAELVGTVLTLSRCSFSYHSIVPLSSLKDGSAKENTNSCSVEAIVSQKSPTFRITKLVEPACWLNLAQEL